MLSQTSATATLADWIETSRTPFDIVTGDPSGLPEHITVLDSAALDHAFQSAFTSRLGPFPLDTAQASLQRIAALYARRFGIEQAEKIGRTVNGLHNAWFHPIFAELTTLLPIRHLARKLHADNPDAQFAVALSSDTLTSLNRWQVNALEPLFLAYEMRRQGASVVIFMPELESPKLTFQLSQAWLPKGYPRFWRNADFSSLMCTLHMRRVDYVNAAVQAKYRHKPGLFSKLRRHGLNKDPATLSVDLTSGPTFGNLKCYSAPPDTPDLKQGFVALIAPLTQQIGDWMAQQLQGKSVKNVHIVDHATMEGGLLASEAVRRGARIHIWPHSANVVHMHSHVPEDVARITVPARSTGAIWATRFGKDKVTIDSKSILPNTPKAPPFDAQHPIHVILFAGAHTLQRVYHYDLDAHKNSWSNTLNGLASLDVDLTVKHKTSWETRAWISELAQDPKSLRFTDTKANDLNLPNMVFASVSLTSTALFEGIARGIPAFTVCDVPVSETPRYDRDYVPAVRSTDIVRFVSELNSQSAWEALRKRQLDWFSKETL